MISRTAAKWDRIAARFHFEPSDIESIKRSTHHQTEPACEAVFSRWLEGKNGTRGPRTWSTIVEILSEADLGTLAEELNSALVD